MGNLPRLLTQFVRELEKDDPDIPEREKKDKKKARSDHVSNCISMCVLCV